jgi:hypothetical protein
MKYNIDLNKNIKDKKFLLDSLNRNITQYNLQVNEYLKHIKNFEIQKQKIEKELLNNKLSPVQLKAIKYFNETAPKLKLNDKYLISAKLSTYGIAIVKYNELFKTNMLYYNGKYIIQSKNVLDTINKLYTDDWRVNNKGIIISPNINVCKTYDGEIYSYSCSKYRLNHEYKKIINLKSSKFTISTSNLENSLKSKDKTVKKMIKTVLNNLIYDK